MRFQRISKVVAIGAAFTLAVGACAPGGPGEEEQPEEGQAQGQGRFTVEPENSGYADLGDVETQDGSISYSVGEDEFTSYNGFTPETYSTYNSVVVDRMQQNFSYFGTDGKIYPNEEIGSYEVTSEDPLTIDYTINPDAAWSDGTPVTTADAVLAWAVQNPNLAADDAPIFNSVSQDLGDDIPEGPEGEPDAKQFTLTYAEPNPDWELQTLLLHPAHVVAEQGGLSVEEFVEAARAGDADALQGAAEFWNTGWDTAPGELPDPELALSNGHYVFESWEPGQSITLTANEEYWGTPAATRQLTIRFAAADTHVQALQNGDLDVVDPQATVDTVDQLESLGDEVQVLTGDTLTWEHLDFNFAEGNPFGESRELREAVAKCVPRQLIVDNLIKPINPEADVMNLREVFPFQEGYEEVADAAYDGSYDEVDIEGAKQLLEEQDAVGQELRIGYNSPNPRRSEEVALITSSCEEAGFEVVDASSGEFFTKTLPSGDYDLALFAWAGSGQITSGENIYGTGKPQNYGQYSNSEVDAAWQELVTSMDPEVHKEQQKEIERLLWEDLAVIPLFAHPGVTGARSDVLNVRQTATQSDSIWNAHQWVRAE